MLVVVMIMVMMSANRANLLALHKVSKLLLDRITSLHSCKQLLCIKLRDRRCHKHRSIVVSLHKSQRLLELCLCGLIGMAENNTARIFYLVIEELTEVLHIHLALIDVGYYGKAIKLNVLKLCILYRLDNVAELSNTRGLDYHAIGGVLGYNVSECAAEITDERAADAARVHLGYIYACVLEKSTVNADLTELVFDKHHALTLISALYKLVYKCCLSCSQKAGNNIYLCHYT